MEYQALIDIQRQGQRSEHEKQFIVAEKDYQMRLLGRIRKAVST